jgi:UDP-3-O-[3-hydroxymyristoyl] glucosamine N-acyltransferase
MSNNSWKQYGGISKMDSFNTINASTIIADQFISRSTRPTYQYLNGTFEVSLDLSAAVNVIAGNSIYTDKDIFVHRDIYSNNKIYFGNNTFQNNGNTFPQLPADNNYAYLYGNSTNIGINTIIPKTVFNITGTSESITDILTVESSNEYIRNIIAQNKNKKGIVIDTDDASSNILFYNDVDTDKLNTPNAYITYENGGFLTTNTTDTIKLSSKNSQIDTSGGQLLMNSTKASLTNSGFFALDISDNININSETNIVMDVSLSKISLNADKTMVFDTSNAFIVNYPSGNLILDNNFSKLETNRDITLLSKGEPDLEGNYPGGNIFLDTNSGNLQVDSNELILSSKIKFAPLSRPIANLNGQIYEETISIFDNSHQTFLYDIYQDDTIKSGHAINCIGIDEKSNTFIHMTPHNKKSGGTIGGGMAPYDPARNVTMVGTTNNDGNYLHSQMTTSSTNTHKYLSTLGINTFQPRSEEYILDVNGAMHLGNGEINEIINIDYQIKHMDLARNNTNYGIAVGTPTTSITSTLPVEQSYQQFLLHTSNGGKSWTKSNIYQLTDTTDDIIVHFNYCHMVDDTYGIVCGDKGYVFITKDSGVNWYRITLVDDSNSPIASDKTLQTISLANYPDNGYRMIISYKNNDDPTTTGIYYYDISDLSTLFTNASNFIISIIPSIDNIGPFEGPQHNIISTSSTTTYNYFAGIGISRYETAALLDNEPSYTDTEAYTINNTYTYHSIHAFDDTHAIAVGDNIISCTNTGVIDEWTNKTTTELGLGNLTLKAVVTCDTTNAIAISDNGIIVISHNWSDANPTWIIAPDNMINTSGSKKLLTSNDGHIQNICMVEISTFLIANVTTLFVDDPAADDANDVTGNTKLLYGYLPNLFDKLNNDVLDVSGSILVSGQVKLFDGEMLVNTINSNKDDKSPSDATTINFGTETHIINIGENDKKELIEEELLKDFDTGSSVINIGAVDPSLPDISTVLINIGNYNYSKTNRKSNKINIGGGKDVTTMGGTVVYRDDVIISSRGKGIQINDFHFGLAIARYIQDNNYPDQTFKYNKDFLPNAVFLPDTYYFTYDFRSNPLTAIENYFTFNKETLINSYIASKGDTYSVIMPSGITSTTTTTTTTGKTSPSDGLMGGGVIGGGVIGGNGNDIPDETETTTVTTLNYDATKYNADFESFVLKQYINNFIATTDGAEEFYTINDDTNEVQVAVIDSETTVNHQLGILYINYPDYHYHTPFEGYDIGLQNYIIAVHAPFNSSKGAGIFVTDNTDKNSGHIKISDDMDAWIMKPTKPNSNALRVDINNLTLPAIDPLNPINPDIGIHGIKNGLVVLNQSVGTELIDSNYKLSVKQFDISNILIRDSNESTDNKQVINTNLLVQKDIEINQRLSVTNDSELKGDVSMNSKVTIAGDVSMNSKVTIAGDVSLGGNVTIDGTFSSTEYQSNYIVNTITNDYEFIITTDMSMSGNLYINGDASFNNDIDLSGHLAVGKTYPVVSVDISYNDAIRVPVGTTNERPIIKVGDNYQYPNFIKDENTPQEVIDAYENKDKYIGSIRYNTDNKQFEGFGPADSWSSLGSVTNISQNTRITAADPEPGDTNNELIFYTANTGKTSYNDSLERMRIDGSGNVGIGIDKPQSNFHVDISNNTEDNNVAGLFTSSNLKPTNNADIESFITNNLSTYLDSYMISTHTDETGITGTAGNYKYDFYRKNTELEDFLLKKYVNERNFNVNTPPYGTYTLGSPKYITYDFNGPLDSSFNMDVEKYVNDNVDTFLKEKRDQTGFDALDFSKFTGTPLQNITYPGIFIEGDENSYNYYYDFSITTNQDGDPIDYSISKVLLYEGYHNHITNFGTQPSIYTIGDSGNEYPPSEPITVESTNSLYRGTVNGASFGNGEYRIECTPPLSTSMTCLFDKHTGTNPLPTELNYATNTGDLIFFITLPEQINFKQIKFTNRNIQSDITVRIATSINDYTGTILIDEQEKAGNFVIDEDLIYNGTPILSNKYLIKFSNFNNQNAAFNLQEIQFIGDTDTNVPFGVSINSLTKICSYTFLDYCKVGIGYDNNNKHNAANINYSYITNKNDQSAMSFGFTNDDKNKMLIRADGNIGIATNYPTSVLTVSGDVSIAERLFVTNDVSMNNSLYVEKDLIVNNDVSFNNRLFVENDVSLNNRLYVGNDTSFNMNVDISGHLAIGKNNPVVSVDISYSDAIRVPVGNKADRPIGKYLDPSDNTIFWEDKNENEITQTNMAKYHGCIRYNQEFKQFEGFGPGDDWGSLGGVINIAQNTRIEAAPPDLPQGTNNNLKFYTAEDGSIDPSGGILHMIITSTGDISMNQKLYVDNDVSFNSKLMVNGDVSMNDTVTIGGDVSMNDNVSINGIVTIGGDVSMNSKLWVVDDVSLNNRLFVDNDVSFTGFLQVDNSANISEILTLSKPTDTALNVIADASFNGNIFLKDDFVINGNIYAPYNNEIWMFDRLSTDDDDAFTETINFGRYSEEVNIISKQTEGYNKECNIGSTMPDPDDNSVKYDRITLVGRMELQGDTYIKNNKFFVQTLDTTFATGNVTFNNDEIDINANNTNVSQTLTVGGTLIVNGSMEITSGLLTVNMLTVTGQFKLGEDPKDPSFVFDPNQWLWIRNNKNLRVEGNIETYYYNELARGNSQIAPFFTVHSVLREITITTMDDNTLTVNPLIKIQTKEGGNGVIVYARNRNEDEGGYDQPIMNIKEDKFSIGKEANTSGSYMFDVSGASLFTGNIDVTGNMSIMGDNNMTGITSVNGEFYLKQLTDSNNYWRMITEANTGSLSITYDNNNNNDFNNRKMYIESPVEIASGSLIVAGDILGLSFSATSDIRLKDNISSLSNSLSIINKLQGVSFTWKNNNSKRPVYGLIAQDVEQILPEVVNTNEFENEQGFKQKSIHYDGIVPHLIESVKELTCENNLLKDKINSLESKIDLLMKHLNI